MPPLGWMDEMAVLRFGECPPHQIARRIEYARDDEMLGRLRWRGAIKHDCFHFVSLTPQARAYCATRTIQPMPNLSATMPKRGEKNVLASGICT